MGNLIDSIATAIGVGVLGYFSYVVLLPQMKQILQDMPALLPPPTTTTTMQPQVAPTSLPPISEPPVQDLIDDALDDDPPTPTRADPTPPPPGSAKRTGTLPEQPKAVAASPTTAGGGTAVEGGIKLVYQTTGRKAALPTKASPHRNGDRYSVNHKFINYIIFAYLKGNQSAVGCKTDGPNHGSCQSKKPDCFWIDPDLQMSNGSIKYGAEYPHPDAHSVSCPSCKSAGTSLSGKWFGYQGIAYQGSGGPSDRWNEVWVDTGAGPNGEPGNKWVQLLKENYTKNIPAEWKRPSGLPVNCSDCGSGTGLEAEIRMRGGKGTSIKYGAVYEINPPGGGGGAAAGFAQSLFTFLEAKTPRRYNKARWAY